MYIALEEGKALVFFAGIAISLKNKSKFNDSTSDSEQEKYGVNILMPTMS